MTAGGDRLVVYGGRDFNDEAAAFAALDEWRRIRVVDELICGVCGVDSADLCGDVVENRRWIMERARGADGAAYRWAASRGVPGLAFAAHWSREGKSAGMRRNERMLLRGQPTVGLEFPGGRGTANMRGLLVRAGVPVWLWRDGVVRPLEACRD